MMEAASSMARHAFYRRFGKRLLDVLVSVASLVLLSPLMFVVALLVRLKLGAPVLFKQQRPGLHGNPFIVYKFRTMTDAKDDQGVALPDAMRLTPFGNSLRSSSLDELPELINVVRGDMSLVGPRPLMMRYLPRYTESQMRRHDVLPGLTGWAQIHGRNARTWDEKFRDDLWYVDHCSLRLDVKILFLTLRQVIKREGISAEGHATMPEFTGTSSE
jgi:sugar transferase EpsL